MPNPFVPSDPSRYTILETELIDRMGGSVGGLSSDQAAKILADVGPNAVASGGRQSVLMDLLYRCRNPLVIQLLIIAGVCYVTDDLPSTIIVGSMVFLSVFLSYFQEARSSRAVEKLQKLVKTTVTVLRDGKESEIPLEDIVPGDIVVLAAGSLIPADLRLLSAKDFFVTQSALTGESMPVEKNADPRSPPGARSSSSPTPASWAATSSAAPPAASSSPPAAAPISARSRRSSQQTRPDQLRQGRQELHVADDPLHGRDGLAVFLIVGLRDHNWLEALLFALSVAVGLTPEMLPMIMTVCLSKGALMMSRKKVIVKHLHAIQNFGAMDVLCTDKTGTLTQDHVVLERYVDVTNRTSEDVLRYAYMNSFYQTGLRNLLDRADPRPLGPRRGAQLPEGRRNPL